MFGSVDERVVTAMHTAIEGGRRERAACPHGHPGADAARLGGRAENVALGVAAPRLLTLDERLEHAAARPVIVPEMIVCDHGKAFISRNFKSSCRFLEIDFQPVHKGSGFEKGHIESMLGSVATLFVQFLPGYTGRSADHRSRHPERERIWSLLELQELLDEWIIAHWQNRPHDGLRDPAHPGRCSRRTRSTRRWSRPAATSPSRSPATTTSSCCPRTGGRSTTTESGALDSMTLRPPDIASTRSEGTYLIGTPM
ncbi:hypothetical protein ACFQVA_42555 [Actinomadura keratinilytica]